jgi:mono/diheme cytochrome c family protein
MVRRCVAVLAVVGVVLGGCATDLSGLSGGALYDAACAHCHGGDLGGGIGPSLGPGSGAVALTDGQLDSVIRIGPGAMPGYGDRLTTAQIESLVSYLRERQSP